MTNKRIKKVKKSIKAIPVKILKQYDRGATIQTKIAGKIFNLSFTIDESKPSEKCVFLNCINNRDIYLKFLKEYDIDLSEVKSAGFLSMTFNASENNMNLY